ncbi:MAG: hypothetical protein E7314_04025 [Clostridiales bacterium]|nr:hypothetical protein [Clostridiales bacterium]
MNQKYKQALSEVEYVLTQLEPEEKAKIPETFKNFVIENKCKWYEISDDDELSEEALAILAIIYRKFLAPIEEREELERIYQKKLKKEKEEIKLIEESIRKVSGEQINYNFVQPNIAKKEMNSAELINYEKEEWYMKLFKKIKKILNRLNPMKKR